LPIEPTYRGFANFQFVLGAQQGYDWPDYGPSNKSIQTGNLITLCLEGAMNRLLLLAVFACLSLRIALAAPQVSHENTYSPFGPDWKSKLDLYNGSYNLLEYVRKGDDVKDPNEVITIQSVNGNVKRSPEDEMNKVRAGMEKKCHDGIGQWNVVAQDAGSFLVEWHANQCRYWPDEEQIARIILGPHSWYLVTYSAKIHELTSDVRAQSIKMLTDATFASVTMAFDPNFITVNVDEVVPFATNQVVAALKTAMESQDCKVTDATASRIVCNRPRVHATWSDGGTGGESVTAMLEERRNQTHVTITTDEGLSGRLAGKKNWSTPIFEGMMENLQRSQQ
jgi:hypothetical protein